MLACAIAIGCTSAHTLGPGSPIESRAPDGQGTIPAHVRVSAPSRVMSSERSIEFGGTQWIAIGDRYSYPLKPIVEQTFGVAAAGVLYTPEGPESPAVTVDVRVTTSELVVREDPDASDGAMFHLVIDADVRDRHGVVVDTVTAEHTVASAFDGLVTPDAVWEACLAAGRTIIEHVRRSGRVRSLVADVPSRNTYTIDLRLLDLGGRVLGVESADCDSERQLRSAADSALRRLMEGRPEPRASVRLSVLGVVEGNALARRMKHGAQVRQYVETALARVDGVTIVDRTQLRLLQDERLLEDVVRDPSVLRSTRIEGVDYLITGSVSVLGD